MIHTNRTVTVGNQESIIDSPIILYRGDRDVEVEFTLNGNKFMFTNSGNVIKSANATLGQLVINTPSGENMFSAVSECHDGRVVFIITKEMIDELIEVGFYSFQIRLFDDTQASRVTIPPIYQGIEIRNPIAAEDETSVVDMGLVDLAIVKASVFEDLSTFLPNGNYNKTDWQSRDVISQARLNKIEDAVYQINENMEATDLSLLNRLDSINQNVNRQMTEFSNQANADIDNFERNITNQVSQFKIDVNATMSQHKNEVDDIIAKVESDKVDKIALLVHKVEGLGWADSIQQLEDEANRTYVLTGSKVRLTFPENEVIEIDKTINKRSGVDWYGSCKIKRVSTDTTTLWALVVANAVDNFKIDGLSFENLGHEIAYAISGSWSINKRNCCIHTYKCENFTISNCDFTKYSEGIVNTACKKYNIFNNRLCANVTGKSIDQFLDDTYVGIAGAQSGDITGWVLSGDAGLYNEDFIIANNHCTSVGLRIGIEVMTQSATHARGLIINNVVKGLHQGIKLYKGTYGELANAVTNVKQCIISGNQISYCWENAIYIRANIGVLCSNNFVSYCGLVNTGSGTAFAGILLRISAETTDSNSSLDAGNFITGNYVYNCGKPMGTPVPAYGIQVRNASAKISNNYIIQDDDWITHSGSGIHGGMGDNAQNSSITDNKIVNFGSGVRLENITPTENSYCYIARNEITKCTTGIYVWGASNDLVKFIIMNNMIFSADLGIATRGTKYATIADNYMDRITEGIKLYGGGFIDNDNRTGPTTTVRNNIMNNVTSPHTIAETRPGDVTFAGRCIHWSNDLVDGVVKP